MTVDVIYLLEEIKKTWKKKNKWKNVKGRGESGACWEKEQEKLAVGEALQERGAGCCGPNMERKQELK